MIEDATIKGDPHEYQRALFVIAKSKNTIINLGTGFGKSLISILCIRHHSSSFQEGKQTLFLVPSDELAIQQSATLRANLPNFSTQAACYDSSNTNGARESLAKANIMVATHGAVSTQSPSFLGVLLVIL
jgi:ERCC4-related helicase